MLVIKLENGAKISKKEEIKARLRTKGLSLSAIARRLNLQPSTVSGVLSGHARSIRVEKELAEALDTTVAELFPNRIYKSEEKQ